MREARQNGVDENFYFHQESLGTSCVVTFWPYIKAVVPTVSYLLGYWNDGEILACLGDEKKTRVSYQLVLCFDI